MNAYRCKLYLADGVTRASADECVFEAGPSQAAKYAAECAWHARPTVVHVISHDGEKGWWFDISLEATASVKWRRP